MPSQTDSPQVLDYFGPKRHVPMRPARPETGDEWALRQLRNRQRRTWVWKVPLLLASATVLWLVIYLLNEPDPSRWHHDGNDKHLYEILGP